MCKSLLNMYVDQETKEEDYGSMLCYMGWACWTLSCVKTRVGPRQSDCSLAVWMAAGPRGKFVCVASVSLDWFIFLFFKKPLGYRPFRRDSSIIIFANSSELLGLTVVVNPFVQSPSCRLCGLDLWRFVWLTSLRCCTRVQGCCEDWSSCYFRVIIRRHCKIGLPCIIPVSTINVYNFMCRIVLVTWDSEIYRNRLNYWACPNCTIPKHVTP